MQAVKMYESSGKYEVSKKKKNPQPMRLHFLLNVVLRLTPFFHPYRRGVDKHLEPIFFMIFVCRSSGFLLTKGL